MSGVVFQGILLNPLADPYTLGVSAGAAFGAALAILLNLGALGCRLGPALRLRRRSGNARRGDLPLVRGGAVLQQPDPLGHHRGGSILSAGISFLKYVADEQVAVIIFWLMGSFASKSWGDVALAAASTAAGLGVFLVFAREMNLMSLGPQMAASLGVDTRRVTLTLLVTASLVAAVCVSVAGIIGFVGLLVPHLMRLVVGPDNRRLIPASLLAGALLLLAADTLTRAVLPAEVPIGVLTALIGGPFFCYVFRRQQSARRVW